MTVFLDRDGTIIKDCHYLKNPELVQLLPGVGEALLTLCRLGYKLVIVTNQSGIARGYFTVADMEAVQNRINEILSFYDVHFDGVYYCPHIHENNCECRKPKIGMAVRAKNDLNIELSESYMVGDKESDIEFGRNIGAKGCFYSLKALIDFLSL